MANWAQGWRYLSDAIAPYWLAVPLLGLLALALPPLLSMRDSRANRAVVVAAMLSAALAHGAYVVYVGGDFMHARLLLPAAFALIAPAAAVRVESKAAFVAVLAIACWAVVSVTSLRVPYNGVGPEGIANERGYYAGLAQHEHPVTIDDYRAYPGAILAVLEEAQVAGGDVLLLQDRREVALRDDVRAVAVVQAASIGIYGAVFGPDVYIADAYGLVDPIAGRLEMAERGRPGHEKVLPEAWVLARFADPAATLPSGVSAPDVSSASAALSCEDTRRLLAAVSERLTPRRFGTNLLEAFRLNGLRIPAEPSSARARLC
jgi:arabinofuranosyltransferase